MRLRTHILDKRGMSLVEVLAALAVFVIGILVIVRLFPPGFFIVKQSENFTLANRLAQSELERLKGTTANLPAGILGMNIVSGPEVVLIDMNPEDMGELPGLLGMTTPPNPYYYSDVNKFRRIYCESTKIPAPMEPPPFWMQVKSLPNENISMYVLNFSPIEWTGSNSVVVRSGPMRRRDVPDIDEKIRSSSDYAIDYNEALLYVRPMTYDRSFVISYSYWIKNANGRPELRPVLSVTVAVLGTTDPKDRGKVQIPSASLPHVKNETGFVGIDAGSETVSRKFDEIFNIGDPWSADNPYQYKVLDNVRGVLAFNPAGHGYEEVTAWGTVQLTAYIDYDVLDWHIIREERKIPEPDLITSQTDLDAKLTLRFIKRVGGTDVADPSQSPTVEMDGSNYGGLSPDHALPWSILAIDIQTGQWFNEASVTTGGLPVMVVNYKDGIIRFDGSMAGRTFRIYYRAEGDWGLQVFKTYETYRRSYNFRTGSTTPLDYWEWDGPEDTDDDDKTKTPYFTENIYFARCYSGMSVALDYTYRVKVGGAYGIYSVVGETFQTSTKSGFTGTCYIDLEPRKTTIARLRGVNISDIQIIRIAKVYGVSVGTRVIWREGGRGFNGGQWRKVDLQTYLMRLQD